jgi:PD-(D/E)XK nuclease superfamily
VLAFGTARSRYSGDIQKGTSAARLPADILTDETVILEIKAVPALLPAHDTQLQTYLRMSGLPVACYSTSMRFIRKMALGDSSDEGFFFYHGNREGGDRGRCAFRPIRRLSA